jgi:glycerophosphoryl diester phosphodiesterase
VELIAHRAGNDASTVAPALAATDTIELDLHLFRGRVEVRHEKVLWPFALYWEKWRFVRRLRPPDLASILAATPDGVHIWLDLKGFSGRLTRRVLREVGDRRPLTASTRNWWTLAAMRRAGDVRTLRSVGSRWQCWITRRFGPGRRGDGVVMHERFADATTVAGLRRSTDDVVVWAVDDLDRAVELATLGVTGLILDDLELIAAIRDHPAAPFT